ncbi:MAG: DUF945 family protein [Gammaproteobacteria bacterium]
MRLLKLSLIPLLAVLVLLVVTPWIIGQNIRANLLNNITSLFPAEAGQQLQFREEDFASGWFSSSATIIAEYNPLGLEEPLVLELDFAINHGPLLMTPEGVNLGLAQARIEPRIEDSELNEELNETLSELPFPAPEIYFDLLVYFDQSLLLNLQIDPINYNGTDGTLAFAGLTASLHSQADLSADFTLNMGAFSAYNPAGDMGFTINGISLSSHSDQLNDVMAPANANLLADQISSAGPFPFSIASVETDSVLRQSAEDASAIDIAQSLTLNDIVMELPVTYLQFDSQINEISRSLIQGYYDLAEQMQADINAGGTMSMDSSALGEDIALIFLRNRLVTHNELNTSAFAGDHNAELHVTWTGVPDLADFASLAPAAVVNALEMSLTIDLDLDAVMRSPAAQMVDTYAQQGFIRIENGRILLQASLADGEFNLNGDILPLNQFL